VISFAMPAISDSLARNQHLTSHKAWRVAFVVPFALVSLTAVAMIIFCPDTPTGKWSERHLAVPNDLTTHPTFALGSVPNSVNDKVPQTTTLAGEPKDTPNLSHKPHTTFDHAVLLIMEEELSIARSEIIREPTAREALLVVFSLQTFVLMATYFCSFGGELAINSILGAHYLKSFPELGQTGSGNWAAMFGLLNVFTRPAGGIVSDLIYKRTHSVWARKHWLHGAGVVCGCLQIVIGTTNFHHLPTLVGLYAGMASDPLWSPMKENSH
jgi:NNP family nitrate/nitrite transporter-like MFS transporter